MTCLTQTSKRSTRSLPCQTSCERRCASSGSSTSLQLALLFSCCLALLPTNVCAYNIDLPSYTKHIGTTTGRSMFGFSIALHTARSGGGYQANSVIVGAPKYDTSQYQLGVIEGGAVFRCTMNDNDCTMVPFDATGNHNNTNGEIIERKSYQWLGATVSTCRDGSLVVACAPRYVFHTMTPNERVRYDPVGTCFATTNLVQFHEISPCRTNNWGYHRQGSCQAGFSVAATSNADRLFIGAPGSWYWQGQVYSVWPHATFPYKPPYYQPFGTGGQAYSYDVTTPQSQVFSTAESGDSLDDDSYLGYSMVAGDFDGDRIEDVAIGMPRGATLFGKIVINSWNMSNIFNITGRQIGEYFGYSLATSDIDGNGLDDLIIGAPMYSDVNNTEGNYDVGRVYILLQPSSRDLLHWNDNTHIREGTKSKGRFGLALSTLGDVNRDGYGDFAVGAPYDGPEGRGVVYIFHGSANGPLQKPSQTIQSEDLPQGAPFPRTFGFSLAGGVDMDGNTYPDLAVGAYLSDQVFIFKSRPVAAVVASTNFLSQGKTIKLDAKNCRYMNSSSCTTIETCWRYTGEKLPSSLDFNVSWILDSKRKDMPRMYFTRYEGRNVLTQPIRLTIGNTFCVNESVYLADNIRDKLTPIEVETRYNIINTRPQHSSIRMKREALEPVIDEDREVVQRDTIEIQKECGEDNICEPDLNLRLKNEIDKYLLGSGAPLVIEVIISNDNEDAFEAAFYMEMPKDVSYNRIEIIGDKKSITPTEPSKKNNYTLKCELGNPLKGKDVVNFKIMMEPTRKDSMDSSFVFYMWVNSTNPEKETTRLNNVYRKIIGIWIQTDLKISGSSTPTSQPYNASIYKSVQTAKKEEDLGPQVVHRYEIHNDGPSIVEEAEILIHYPYATAAGDLLMYLTNQPETDGEITCDPHLMVDPQNLRKDAVLSRWPSGGSINFSNGSSVTHTHSTTGGGTVHTSGGTFEHSSGSSGSSGTSSTHSQGAGASGGSGTQTNVVAIAQSTGTSGVRSQAVDIGRGQTLSETERRRKLEEDKQPAKGDASFDHISRAEQAYAADAQARGQGGQAGGWTQSSSWNSSMGHGPIVYTQIRNSSMYDDGSGRPVYAESSTQYSTVLNQGPPSQYTRQQYLANYQQPQQNVRVNYGSAVQQQPQDARIIYGSTVQQQQQQQQQAQPQQRQQYQYNNARDNLQISVPNNQQNQQNQAHYATNNNNGGSQQRYNIERSGSPAVYNELSTGKNTFDKPSVGGQTFRTGVLEFGPLNRDNVDNELANRGAHDNNGGYGYQRSYSSSSQLPSATNSKPYFGMENRHSYQQTYPQYTSSIQQNRYRRDAASTEEPTEINFNNPCRSTRCETLRCTARNLGKDTSVLLTIRARMVASTMERLAGNLPLNVSTMAVVTVTKLPTIGKPKDAIIKSHEVFYTAVPEVTQVPDVVPLWVVVLAACAGALILMLLILLLYKCGFFKRNRPADHSMERQPLRNGYHGDEHL